MAKPPQSSPHSDIDGVHQDEKPNVESAQEAGQGGGDLQRAHEENQGRPPYANSKPAGQNRRG